MAFEAESVADSDRIKALELQVQELRQFCQMVVVNLPDAIMPQAHKDFWWTKLTAYKKVEQQWLQSKSATAATCNASQ